MSYIDHNLLSNETVLYRAHLSRIVFAFPVLMLGVALVLPVLGGAALGLGGVLGVIALGYLVKAYVAYKTSEFAVTNKRVIMKVGLIRRTSVEIVLGRVESIVVDQGIAGRVFDFGSIAVVGTGGTKDPFHRIAAPLRFRRAVQEQLAA
jgi:uncharacterized membrane protein YdbT with pleckstrin-like domain